MLCIINSRIDVVNRRNEEKLMEEIVMGFSELSSLYLNRIVDFSTLKW